MRFGPCDGVSTVGGGVRKPGFKVSGGLELSFSGFCKTAACISLGVRLKGLMGVENAAVARTVVTGALSTTRFSDESRGRPRRQEIFYFIWVWLLYFPIREYKQEVLGYLSNPFHGECIFFVDSAELICQAKILLFGVNCRL